MGETMKELAAFWGRMMRCNCNIRINAFVTTVIPIIDQLAHTWPTFQSFLPSNLYGFGFVALGILNVLLHARTAAQQERRDAEPPVIGG